MMIQRLMTEPFLTFLTIVLVLEFSIVFPQIIWLRWRSGMRDRWEKDRIRFQEELGSRFLSSLEGAEQRKDWVQEARVYSSQIVRKFLTPYLASTFGEQKELMVGVYNDVGLLSEDLEDLNSKSWQTRLRAVRRLSLVATKEDTDRIMALRQDIDVIRVLAAQTVAKIGTAKDVFDMMHDWSITNRLQEQPFHMLASSMPAWEFQEIMNYWGRFESPVVRRILLSVAVRRDPPLAIKQFDSVFESEHKELRIAACSVAALPGAESFAADALRELACDASWEVRAMAVKAMGRSPNQEFTVPLTKALGDKSFWVRQNAASALSALGRHGREQLELVASESTDSFASDAARGELDRYQLFVEAGGQAA